MNSEIERLRTALAGRYEVEHELGRGGMAVVFLGTDPRLGRRVAIKVFEQGAGLGAAASERFLREIQVAARLQHPNILPVFESGEAEGLVYYVMPYVTGASLRERLEREGPLPVADAVRIAREVAEALDHAHRAGVVHRDIKPDNIMLADGVAVVADFGIARAMAESGSVTETGMAVGTPAYMSPEQATAHPRVDGRSDIYALGCVVYEMLAGGPPFSGPTAQSVMARHAADAVPPLRTVRDVPAELETALMKALAKVPADRWSSGRAFAEALEQTAGRASSPVLEQTTRPRALRYAVVAAGVAVIALTTWFGWTKLGAERAAADAIDSLQTVAVLPFVSIGDSADSYIADGLTETVNSGLVRAPGLSITSSSRMARFRDSVVDVREVGREVGARAIVTATVQRSGNRLRVTAHLVSVADGRGMWSETFDGTLADQFSFQDSITGKIIDALLPRLAPARRAQLARGVRTRDPEAWRLYIEGRRAYDEFSEASSKRSLSLLRAAIARDSLFADAWAALVPTLDLAARFSREPPETFNAAMRIAANKAVELDSLSALAYLNRAWTRALNDWDWDGALRDQRRALALAPGSPDIDAGLFAWLDQVDSAMYYSRRNFDSTNSNAWFVLGALFQLRGQLDSAIHAEERALAIDSNHAGALIQVSHMYLDAGRRSEGDRAIARFLSATGNDAQGVGLASVYYRRSQNRRASRDMLRRLNAISRERSWGVHSAMSMVRLAVGDRAGALDALDSAVAHREYLVPATILMNLAPLQNEPRYRAARRAVFGERSLIRQTLP
jgi:TolB-like protein/Tfp pilus assembly protein PilF